MKAIVELIGPIAVLIGLIFVGLELRQNSQVVQSQTRAQISIAWSDMLESQRSDQALLEAREKLSNGEDLDFTDELRLFLYYGSVLRLGENAFYQLREGYYSNDEFEGERNFWRSFTSRPSFRDYWQTGKLQYAPEFVTELDTIINEQ